MSALDRAIDFLTYRAKAYRLTFQGPIRENAVLRDLARFCRAFETTAIPGDRDRSLLLEGRREVWLRIVNHLRLTPEQLYELYGGVQPLPTSEERRK